MKGVMEVISTKLMNTKKGGRIWLEGLRLSNAGFDKGETYSTTVEGNKLIIKKSPIGNKKVSSKRINGGMNPIIDLCGNWLNEIFQSETKLKAVIRNGEIFIYEDKEELRKREREERLLINDILSEGSLCTGIGVSTLAINETLHSKGLNSKTSFIVEREPKYIDVLTKNNKSINDETLIFNGSLENFQDSKIPTSDILSLSLPCTGHSPAGKTSRKLKNAESHPTDATAIFGAMNIIRKSNPSIILSENVTQAQNSPTYILFKQELSRLDYTVFEIILDGFDANSIENRKRYWFVALSNGVARGFSLDSIKDHLPKPDRRKISNILEDVDHNWFSPETFQKREIENKRNGRGFKTNFVTQDNTEVGTIPRNYTKRQVSNPHLQSEDTGLIRLFTPVEHAKAKGIPPELVKDIPATCAHEGLGQSILYQHAVALTKLIANHIKNLRKNLTQISA